MSLLLYTPVFDALDAQVAQPALRRLGVAGPVPATYQFAVRAGVEVGARVATFVVSDDAQAGLTLDSATWTGPTWVSAAVSGNTVVLQVAAAPGQAGAGTLSVDAAGETFSVEVAVRAFEPSMASVSRARVSVSVGI